MFGLLILSIVNILLFLKIGIIILEFDVVLYVIWFVNVWIFLINCVCCVCVVVLYIFLFIGIWMYVGLFWNGFNINFLGEFIR